MEYDTSWKPRVLVVEDDIDQRELYSGLIRSLGYEVRTEENSARGLETTLVWRPDLVLLDRNLPDGDGLSILEEVNSEPDNWDIAFIVVTADDNPEMAVEVMSLGAVDYLKKPFRPMELLLKLDIQFKYKRARLEAEEARNRLEVENALLSRYFSADLIEKILSGAISTEVGGHLTQATVLVLDVRGSTSIAEKMPAGLFAEFLSDLFAGFADIIYRHYGTIINFTGDGFVVGFGVPKAVGDHALNAARTAIDIRSYLEEYNKTRPASLDAPVDVGVGIATGELFAGNVGSVHRLDYTVLGDPVNLAARLQGLTKGTYADVFVDGPTHDLLAEKGIFKRVRLDHVRGKEEEVRIFYLVGLQ